MVLKLYMLEASPPVRSVLLTAKALNLEMELINVDLFKNEHMTAEFLKRNPQHTVPTLVDDGFAIWDSHAIATYLVEKYGKNDDLYPKDIQIRATVDQRLHFDSGILFPRTRGFLFPILFLNSKTIYPEKLKDIREGYSFLNEFLEESSYLVGDNLTVADLCCVATFSTLNVILPASQEEFPNVISWFERLKNLPYYEEANGNGAALIGGLLKNRLGEDYRNFIDSHL